MLLLTIGISAAQADTISFVGARFEDQPAASAGGRCSPVPTLTVNNVIGVATGTSNLGNFTVDESACLNTPFPAALTDGFFTWTFSDGDTLTGTWSGLDTRITIPTGHLLTINETYTIASGTGAFLDATGSIVETGTGMSNGVTSVNNFTFTGTITGPDVSEIPEPSSLVLLGTGLTTALLTVCRTRKRYLTPPCGRRNASIPAGLRWQRLSFLW